MKYPDDFIDKIICGDCLEVVKDIPDNSLDAVVVDFPYAKKYLYLYEGIAEASKRILKVGGSLLMIIPHYSIPGVIESVSKYLKWRWMNCMWQHDGQHPRMAMGVEVVWKPIGWWVKDKWPAGRGFVKDGFVNQFPDKKLHEWEQSLTWAEYCMKFVPVGGIVLDPSIGSGTLAVACKKSGRNFIGIDISEKYCDISRKRLESIAI